ncbi:hypothetical protein ACJU26_11380 [Acidithiobacillus sp. M4-SHS-6]|uniref:hypothetical protein n=1 Tax=Acidithiobacillus sp. M4-SHS-6 TaxID=3383024 RepID=UPI0039BE0F33
MSYIKNAIFPVMFGIAMINACAASADDFDGNWTAAYGHVLMQIHGTQAHVSIRHGADARLIQTCF